MLTSKIDLIYQKLQKNDIQSAALMAEKLYQENPNNSLVVNCFGMVALAAKDYASATQILTIACQLNPSSVDSYYHLALAYQEQTEYPLAIENYEKALTLNSKHLAGLANCAVCYEKTQQWEKAISLYQRFIQLSPNHLEVLNNFANLYRNKKDYQESRRHFERILEHSPIHGPSLLDYAHLLFEMTNYQEALAKYQQYQQQFSEDLSVNLWLAETHYKLKNTEQASKYFQYCLDNKINPQRAGVGKALLLLDEGKYLAAEEAVNRILKDDPQNKVARYSLAMIYSHQTDHKKLEKAQKLLSSLIAEFTDYHLAYDCLARVLTKQGLASKAIDYAEKANALLANHLDYQMTLQDAYTHAGRLQDAHLLLSQIVIQHPNLAAAVRQKGIVELRLKNNQMAMSSLQKAVALDPKDQRSLSHYIIALQANKQFEKAKKLQSFEQLVFNEYLIPKETFKDLNAFNQALEEEVKSHPTLKWEPKGLATMGGYMTENLAEETSPAIAMLVQLILETIEHYRQTLTRDDSHPFLGTIPRQYKLHLWAVLLHENGQVGPHIHEDSWISGAYYVKLPQLGEGKAQSQNEEKANYQGWIEFGQPHQEIPFQYGKHNYQVKPEQGKLVLFPSYYFHQTIPYSDKNERISIAFDVEALD